MMVFMLVFCILIFFFFKQKTAYEMRISDWSSDVCSSDLIRPARNQARRRPRHGRLTAPDPRGRQGEGDGNVPDRPDDGRCRGRTVGAGGARRPPRHPARRSAKNRSRDRQHAADGGDGEQGRSEEHTSELQSLMRISYAVFCLKKKKITTLLLTTNTNCRHVLYMTKCIPILS